MPEGPEIRRAADSIEDAIVRQPLQEVWFAFDRLKPYEVKLAAETVMAVQTKGKAMVIRFTNRLNIYSHNQLYGVWMVRSAYRFPETTRQLRLAIHTAKKSALLYSASDIEVLHDEELDQHPFLSRVGPDVLSDRVTIEQIEERLSDRRFYRRNLATLLLDQSFLCGLGNYLRSEILFFAGIHPSLRAFDCSPEQRQRLAQGAIALTRQSYETGGITNTLERAMRLKAEGWTRSQYRHLVFNREGKPCFNCGESIVKLMAGGRRCYYCPKCQPDELP